MSIAKLMFLCITLVASTEVLAQGKDREKPAKDSFQGRSETCGPVVGKTAKDLRNLQTFCSQGIPKGAVVGAYAMGPLLWIKVSRLMAEGLRADRLSAEQLVRNWIRGWKSNSDSRAVTVTVEWRDVEIAKSQTTWSGKDEVTIR
ncbi:MAG: hypothetical protein OXB98_00685 [Bryobacterales bacterium]|nr:hypothetical protein [Bryobacterales bacterium]